MFGIQIPTVSGKPENQVRLDPLIARYNKKTFIIPGNVLKIKKQQKVLELKKNYIKN